MRTLASIQKIVSVSPIENSDMLDVIKVLGWQCVAKKGEFKPNGLCIYVEIDSILPDCPEFEFIRARHFRIRTIRLRGVVSQGLCLPLDILLPHGISSDDCIEGQDVTDVLRIIKYEPPVPANMEGTIKGSFPSFIPKTDETRVQVLQHVLDKYKDSICYVTEKLDGSSVTCYIKDGIFGVCSRNIELKETEGNTIWKVVREIDLENKLRSLGKNCAVQGEIIGEGIQGNKYKLQGQDIMFFNLFDIDKYQYFGLNEFKNTILNLQLHMVPILSETYILENNIDELIKMSIGKSLLNKDVYREGIVIRPLNEIIDHEISNGFLHNDRLSLKAINPEFLIKYSE